MVDHEGITRLAVFSFYSKIRLLFSFGQ